MKNNYLLSLLALWVVISVPAVVCAEDLGALRLSQVKGDVQIQAKESEEWLPATMNLPVQNGDRLWVPPDAWAQIETRTGSVVRLDAESSLEILTIDENALRVYLSQGQVYLHFQKSGPDSVLQVDTPVASTRVYDSATVNIALDDNGRTEVSVFRGAAFTENRSGEVRVSAGKMLSLDEDMPELTSLGPPSEWEKWNREWDESLAAVSGSEQYLPEELSVYGRDLNKNGRWVSTTEYGYVWTPTMYVSAGWVPYRQGRWVWVGDDYVWIASEPWGWAPYHYGRWAHVDSFGWCWVPPRRHEVYWGPGYVSWVETETEVAWVPLAPGEMYYGYGFYGPHSANIVNIDVNMAIPGRNYRNVHVHDAVTILHRDTFLHGRHHPVGHRDNPFLGRPIHFGRPGFSPERNTRMPIIRDIPPAHEPPRHIRTRPEHPDHGDRHFNRNRDRSVFSPASPPRPLTPAVRMSPDPDVKRHYQGGDDRRRMLEHSVAPGRDEHGDRGRDGGRGASSAPSAPPDQRLPVTVSQPPDVDKNDRKSPAMFRGQQPSPRPEEGADRFRGNQSRDVEAHQPVKPSVPVRQHVPPAVSAPPVQQDHDSNNDRERPSMFRGQQPSPRPEGGAEHFRGRPGKDIEAHQPVKPSAPVQHQVAPPPPVPKQQPHQPDMEAMKRMQQQQAADKKKKEEEQAAAADKVRGMMEQQKGRHR